MLLLVFLIRSSLFYCIHIFFPLTFWTHTHTHMLFFRCRLHAFVTFSAVCHSNGFCLFGGTLNTISTILKHGARYTFACVNSCVFRFFSFFLSSNSTFLVAERLLLALVCFSLLRLWCLLLLLLLFWYRSLCHFVGYFGVCVCALMRECVRDFFCITLFADQLVSRE